jgi:acyl carrier protein
MRKTIESELKNVMSAVFGISVDDINNNSSSITVKNWDSLKHMNLIVALEEEFEIEFSDDEIMEMKGYASIKYNLINRLG